MALALNGCTPLIDTVVEPGVTAIDRNVAVVTATVDAALLPPKLAVIAEEPLLTPITAPLVWTTVATTVAAVVQFDVALTSRVDPSPRVAMVTNTCTPLVGTDAVPGVTAIDTTVDAGVPGSCPPPPQAASKLLKTMP